MSQISIRDLSPAVEAHLRERGHPIPTNDLWIAACALCADARLLTSDTRFAAVPGLIAMSWQEER
jgi:predicted nucleic acid-binding protein